jgi:uncharacterized paraquat-inducible protein A
MKELTDIKNIIESTSDNTELGKKIREYYKQSHENENGFIVCHKCHTYQSPLNHLCKFCYHPLHGDNDHE